MPEPRCLVVYSVFLLLCHVGARWIEDGIGEVDEVEDRESKFFPFFIGPTIIRVANTQCTGENGLSGTCYAKDQCGSAGGKASGSCSKGFGRCCVFKKTCGDTTNVNCTYFVSPGYPAGCPGDSGVCSLTVLPCGKNVCQLRLDFQDFNLAPPDANGHCNNDFFLVSGGASNVPKLCGMNTGEHVYVDFNGNSPITLTVDMNSALTMMRTWRVKITQIKCCDRAPIGCLMEYTSTSGQIKSFNYGSTASSATSPDLFGPGSRELANLNYGVCVEMAPGYCSIEWSQNPDDPYSFTVSNDTETTVGLPTADASLTGANCTDDYIVIPSPSQMGVPLNSDRFCGNALPTVTSSSKPFVLTVVTDDSELNDPPNVPPDVANRGFCLNYRQLPCM